MKEIHLLLLSQFIEMEYLQSLIKEDPWSWQIVLILVGAGLIVGVINTLAGNGTVITYTLFQWLGFDTYFANGTPRLGVVMQTLTASLVFLKKGIFKIPEGMKLAVPVAAGSIAGAQIAAVLPEEVLKKGIAVLMLIMLASLFYKPGQWLKGSEKKTKKERVWLRLLIYFLIGIYGGFIHIGVGILLLFALVLFSGYDLVKANSLKVFIVLIYSPFALAVFMINGHVDYAYGLVAAGGNMIGGLIASNIAISWGAKFLQIVLAVVILVSAANSFGLFG